MANFHPIEDSVVERRSNRTIKARPPFAIEVSFDRRGRKIKLKLNTGLELSFDPALAFGLQAASDIDLEGIEVEGAGGSIYFPALDADFSVARILEGFLGPLDWTRQEARAVASRENGKLGGRPRKNVIPEIA